MNPEIGEANPSSGSANIPSVDNAKPIAEGTVLAQSKSESDIDRDDSTPPEVEEIKQPDLDNRTSSSNFHENESNEILVKENKDNHPESIDIRGHEDHRTVNDSEMSTFESARNSVHEILVNKSDQSTTENENTNLVVDCSKIVEAENIDSKLNITNEFVENKPTEKLLNELNESKNSINASKELESYKESATDEDSMCGFCSFHPKWIQKYATPRIFLLFFSIVGIINGTYYPYIISIITTLEKRYAFQTKVSGTILLSNEITPVFLGVLVGYFGGRTHRPRMVTIGMLFSAACCFVSALPYFIYGSAKHLIVQSVNNLTDYEVCVTEERIQNCDIDDRPPTMMVVGIFIIACFLKGFADLSYYVIGVSFIDDNIKKKNTPVYLAIAFALRYLGPLVGFLMSSALLKIYENPLEDPGFGPDDPRWIGAWWIGFALQGILLVIFSLPLALFPRRLPSQQKVEKIPSETSKESIRDTLKGIVAALKRLGKNPIYVLMIFNTILKIFGHFGHSIMLPKYVENQFRLSAADASLFSGAIAIFCIMISTMVGGFLVWKYRPRIKVLLSVMVMSEIISCLSFLVLMIPRCEPIDIQNFGVNNEGLILNSVCNQNCDCSTISFTPFCGPDGKTTYFSPCYAGCTQEITTEMLPKTQTVFGNCSCVNGTNSPEVNTATITEGFCPDENCWSKAIVYLIILFFMLAISSTFTVAHTMILLRSVHPADKSICLGTFEAFTCLFGFIPFPVTYGALVDSACLVWEKSCGETGNCWFYDMDKYRYLLHGASLVFCSLSVICLTTLYFLSSRVRDLYVEENEEEPIDNIKLDTVSGSVTKL